MLNTAILQYHDLAILELRNPHFQVDADELRVSELTRRQVGPVLEVYGLVGHKIAEERVIKRFQNGLRFFQLWHHDALAGTTWIISGSPRYVDELAWNLPVRQDELWIRDIFISPAFRGQRLFSSFLGLIAACYWQACRCVWSDVSWSNKPSLRAHAFAGFQVRARAQAINVAGRVLLRSEIMPWSVPVVEIEPTRQFIWLGPDRLRIHRELIA